MQNKIIHRLRETYQPDAIILHGSRARGKAREHSDWDFILLNTQPTNVTNGRIMYRNQNVEYSVHQLPVTDIVGEFEGKLQGAEVVYENNDEGTALLQQANAIYQQGVHWTVDKVASHKLWVTGRVNGMKDNVDNPVLFNKYYCDFYCRVFNYWYWLLQHKHSQPIYIALEEVKEKDPDYFNLVSTLAHPATPLAKKVDVAEKIYITLFANV